MRAHIREVGLGGQIRGHDLDRLGRGAYRNALSSGHVNDDTTPAFAMFPRFIPPESDDKCFSTTHTFPFPHGIR